MRQDTNKERRERERAEQIKATRLKTTATETNEPIKAVRLWRYNRNIMLVLGTDDKLYRITGNRRYRLKALEQPLDKNWHIQEKYYSLTSLVEFVNSFDEHENLKTILNFLNEDYESELQPLKVELSPYIFEKLEEIAKTKDMTPKEAFKQLVGDNLKTMRKAEDNFKAIEEAYKERYTNPNPFLREKTA